jgi:hypothetical protein
MPYTGSVTRVRQKASAEARAALRVQALLLAEPASACDAHTRQITARAAAHARGHQACAAHSGARRPWGASGVSPGANAPSLKEQPPSAACAVRTGARTPGARRTCDCDHAAPRDTRITALRAA